MPFRRRSRTRTPCRSAPTAAAAAAGSARRCGGSGPSLPRATPPRRRATPHRVRRGLAALQPVEALFPAGGVAGGCFGRQLVDENETRAVALSRELKPEGLLAPGVGEDVRLV